MATRQSCLVVLTSSVEGVDAGSFIQAFTLAQTAFNVQLCSPHGKAVEFINQDESGRKWLNDFKNKSYATPVSIATIEASRYGALLVPHAPGCVNDLARDSEFASILQHFIQEKKPVCGIGLGVAALCGARRADNTWCLNNYSLTATSVFELARTAFFGNLSLIPEDFIKDNGAKYSCSEPGEVHVVIDRHVVTAQNRQSTSLAVQNLILLANQRNTKPVMNAR